MPGGNFIDTNLWVYAHLEAPGEPRSELAWRFIQTVGAPVISPQVVTEYYNVMLRNGRTEEWIRRNLARMLEQCRLQPADTAVVRRTLAVRSRYGFSIWDSQIVAAALEAGCDTLFTEDLQAGQLIDGLTVANPLLLRSM